MPIPFSVWIEGVVGNADIISNRELLKRVWLNGEKNITSMASFDESYEQLFDDLDALGYLEIYSTSTELSTEQQIALREYIEAFRDFDDSKFLVDKVLDVKAMLLSSDWKRLETKALDLVSIYNAG